MDPLFFARTSYSERNLARRSLIRLQQSDPKPHPTPHKLLDTPCLLNFEKFIALLLKLKDPKPQAPHGASDFTGFRHSRVDLKI